MEFRGENPGSVKFGNFINYYNFNNAEERLKLLPTDTDVWTNHKQSDNSCSDYYYLVLDVGCNCGNLTKLLYDFLNKNIYLGEHDIKKRVKILAVDIDANLIQRAKQTNTNEYITYECLDVMNHEEFQKVVSGYLGSLGRQQFNAVCCFSITMWIHLNHHESGLKQFLRKLTELAELFLIEPQPWKCYQTAERRLKKTGTVFPLFSELKWRSQVEQEIQTFLEINLAKRKVYECNPTKWNRKICFYR